VIVADCLTKYTLSHSPAQADSFIMVQYTPPPEDLSHLNPIQRYMQKGQLEARDWAYLLIFVLAYLAARPTIQRGIKWYMADEDLREGERAQKEFLQSKAKAKISPNSIRGTEKEPLASIPENAAETTTGSSLTSQGKVINRKDKQKPHSEVLLDWDDQPEQKQREGDKADVVAWMDKWANEE
jgi:hypothetical protein